MHPIQCLCCSISTAALHTAAIGTCSLLHLRACFTLQLLMYGIHLYACMPTRVVNRGMLHRQCVCFGCQRLQSCSAPASVHPARLSCRWHSKSRSTAITPATLPDATPSASGSDYELPAAAKGNCASQQPASHPPCCSRDRSQGNVPRQDQASSISACASSAAQSAIAGQDGRCCSGIFDSGISHAQREWVCVTRWACNTLLARLYHARLQQLGWFAAQKWRRHGVTSASWMYELCKPGAVQTVASASMLCCSQAKFPSDYIAAQLLSGMVHGLHFVWQVMSCSCCAGEPRCRKLHQLSTSNVRRKRPRRHDCVPSDNIERCQQAKLTSNRQKY